MTITRNANGTMRFSVSYSARMLTDVNGIIADVREGLKGVKYDTIVGRGTSGMLIVPIVARALRKNYFIIRKDEERAVSHSDGTPYMGTLGKRWLFLDDFCSSGQTFRVVRDAVKDAEKQVNAMRQYRQSPDKRDTYGYPLIEDFPYDDQFATELVGYFEYNSSMSGSRSPFTRWDDSQELSLGSYWNDCPFDVKQRENRDKYRASRDAVVAIPGSVTIVSEGRLNSAGQPCNDKCTVGQTGCNCIPIDALKAELKGADA